MRRQRADHPRSVTAGHPRPDGGHPPFELQQSHRRSDRGSGFGRLLDNEPAAVHTRREADPVKLAHRLTRAHAAHIRMRPSRTATRSKATGGSRRMASLALAIITGEVG